MAVSTALREWVRAHTLGVAVAITAIGYTLVLNAFEGIVPLFPSIGESTVRLFSTVIVVINATTLTALLVGVYYIRQRRIDRHRTAMVTAVALELGFLVLYLWKVGGGGELYLQANGLFRLVYLLILAIHLVCSALSVPLVIYAVLLGMTRSPAELEQTVHARVGRFAVAVWSVSLVLGIATSVMLRIAGSELKAIGTIVLV